MTSPMISESALAAADSQFTQLYSQHQEHVQRIVRKYSPLESNRDDVEQLVWLAVMTALRAGRAPVNGRDRGWLGTIAQQVAVGERKQANLQNQREISISQESEETDGAYLDRLMFHEGYCDEGPRSITSPLTDALQGLGRRAKQVMEMRFVVGLEPQEVADALGITRQSVNISVTRSLAILRANVNRPSTESTYAR